MTRTLLQTAVTTDQAGQPMKLDYYMLCEMRAGLEQYGAEIVLERGREQERCSVGQITPQPRRMANIIRALAAGTVTPATLREILEDIL